MNLKKLVTPILIIILIGSLIVGWFYWFQWRPAEIRKLCLEEVKEKAKSGNISNKTDFNIQYRFCLVEHGLKPKSIFPK